VTSDRDKIIAEYYSKFFGTFCYSGTQSKGSAYFHKIIEKKWGNTESLEILEVGAGSGEHLIYLPDSIWKNTKSYTLLDLRHSPSNFSDTLSKLRTLKHFDSKKLSSIQGSVENIPLKTGQVNRVTSTCLFHHLENPLKAFQEIRRVLCSGGEAAIGLPTDPGMLNRLVKRFITFPAARKSGIESPELIYALEHRNHIGGLIQIAKEVFKEDQIKFDYKPFKLPAWNFNLAVVIRIKRI